MGKNTEFEFGWNSQPDSLAGGVTGRTVDTEPASDSQDYGGTWWFFGVCSDAIQVDAFEKTIFLNLNSHREELRQMAQLPSYKHSSKNESSSSQSERKQRSGLPYLKVENVSADPKEARIMDVQITPDRGDGQRKFNDIVVKLYFGGQMYLWGLKFNNPNYGHLLDIFGSDTDHWKEQKFMLFTEVQEFDGRTFIRITPSDKPAKRKQDS